MAKKGVRGGFIPHLGVVLYPRPPTGGATLKCGIPSPQLDWPHRCVGVHHPNLKSHSEAQELIPPNRGATQLCRIRFPDPQLKWQQKIMDLNSVAKIRLFEGFYKKNSKMAPRNPKFTKAPTNHTKTPSPYLTKKKPNFTKKKTPVVAKKNPNLTKQNPSCYQKKNLTLLGGFWRKMGGVGGGGKNGRKWGAFGNRGGGLGCTTFGIGEPFCMQTYGACAVNFQRAFHRKNWGCCFYAPSLNTGLLQFPDETNNNTLAAPCTPYIQC